MIRKTILLYVICLLFAGTLTAQERPDALQLYKQGNYARAVQVCFDEIKELPKNMNSYVVLGWSLLKLGRHQDAIEYGKKALEISRYDNRILQIIAEAYFNSGNNLEALKFLEEYATISPTGDLIDEVYYYMGEIFIRLGEFNHADIAITTAVHHDPNVAVWWSRLGYAREQAKDYRFSLDAYNKAIQLNPNLGDAQRGRQRVLGLLNAAEGNRTQTQAVQPAPRPAPVPEQRPVQPPVEPQPAPVIQPQAPREAPQAPVVGG